MLRIPDQVETAAHDSLCVAAPSPEKKREGWNVYEELVLIVLCDVKVIYVSDRNCRDCLALQPNVIFSIQMIDK